jgi:hypothetical protein
VRDAGTELLAAGSHGHGFFTRSTSTRLLRGAPCAVPLAAGLVLLLTGSTGFCPLYAVIHIDTAHPRHRYAGDRDRLAYLLILDPRGVDASGELALYSLLASL